MPVSFGVCYATKYCSRFCAAIGCLWRNSVARTKGAQWLGIVFWPLCVPFFFVVSLVCFVANLTKAEASLQRIFARSWHRLVVPYLARTAIYTGLLVARTLLVHGNRECNWWRIPLYGKSAPQLYFLPARSDLAIWSGYPGYGTAETGAAYAPAAAWRALAQLSAACARLG